MKSKTRKVMVVCSETADNLEARLVCDGWAVIWVYDGKTAIAKARREHFDMAALISTGKDMDITETLFNLRDVRESMPVVVVHQHDGVKHRGKPETYPPPSAIALSVQGLEGLSRYLADGLIVEKNGVCCRGLKRKINSNQPRGGTMITRMILVNVPLEKAAQAELLWKEDCGPLLIKQPGCKSEQFLRGRENPGEFISLSTWENQEAIERYRASDAHHTIQQHGRALMNVAKVEVKTYEVLKYD